jgi:hypothetical protein
MAGAARNAAALARNSRRFMGLALMSSRTKRRWSSAGRF